MSILPQRGQDEEATTYLDRILPELNEILENSLSGTAFVEGGKVYVKIASPYNAADKDLELGKMLTNASNIVTIDTEKLEDAAVTLAKVANGSISGDKLVTSEAVITQSAQIGDGTILTAAIGDAQITNAKVNDLAANKITAGTLAADRIGANSITSGKIAANAITASEIATDAVTTAKLAANSITSAKLATSSLITQSAQINDGIITNAKINDLNASKINAGTLNVGRISAGSITTGKIIANAFTSFSYFQTGLATGVGQSFTWSPPISGQSYDCLIIANFITTGSTNSGASTTNKVETTGSGISNWSRTVGLSGIIAAGNNTFMTNFGNNSGFFSTITGGNTYTTTLTTTTNLGSASVHCLVLMRNR